MKKGTIVISEDELDGMPNIVVNAAKPEDDIAVVDKGDILDDTILITTDELAEDGVRTLFRSQLLRQFVAFVSIGLPDVFLKAHPDLVRSDHAEQSQIKTVIDKVQDRALRQYLLSRLEAIQAFSRENPRDDEVIVIEANAQAN